MGTLTYKRLFPLLSSALRAIHWLSCNPIEMLFTNHFSQTTFDYAFQKPLYFSLNSILDASSVTFLKYLWKERALLLISLLVQETAACYVTSHCFFRLNIIVSNKNKREIT